MRWTLTLYFSLYVFNDVMTWDIRHHDNVNDVIKDLFIIKLCAKILNCLLSKTVVAHDYCSWWYTIVVDDTVVADDTIVADDTSR